MSGFYLHVDDECPHCKHPLSQHILELGCNVGWGSPSCRERHDGCDCPLTMAQQFDPPREKDLT
jgi:hypothetical protein